MFADGTIDSWIMQEYSRISEYPLGTLSINLTTPVNELVVKILVDFNAIQGGQEIYNLRVEQIDSDAFMDIKTDPVSVRKAVNAILDGSIPLYNRTKHIDTAVYDYLL